MRILDAAWRSARSMAIKAWPCHPAHGVLLVLWAIAPVVAQEGVFDDEPKAESKKDEPKKAEESKKEAVSDRDAIGFTQENVASQMTELEERMFRLSEALRSLEPENASRLGLALKFSREELILQQMRDAQKLLKDAEIGKAETEVRELLAKLEHLRSLLLAEDLDFQLKLARLRQMKEAMGQIERIITEERRELSWSRSAIETKPVLESMRAKRAELEALVREQEAVIGATRDAGALAEAEAMKAAKGAAATREGAVRERAGKLAADPLFAKQDPGHLREADPHLEDAGVYLTTPDAEAAIASEEKALDLLRKELERLDARIAETEKGGSEEEFKRFEQDQAKNRTATDTLGQVSARLGNSGVALQKTLIRASGSMQEAEGDLAKTEAEPAAVDQEEALKHLDQSKAGLGQAMEKLLVELRTELQARIVAELAEMHEIQAAIRESTEALAPRAAEKARTALIALAGLGKQEGELGGRTEELLALVEETEFGIALPTALRVLSREMRTVEGWLGEGDATARTVTLEKRIEDDLLGLLQAMRRLPPTTPPKPGTPLPTNPRDRERELNRLVAELKMIRLLQSRLNDDTAGTDGTRGEAEPLPAALRGQIEALKQSQEEIRDSLALIGVRIEFQ